MIKRLLWLLLLWPSSLQATTWFVATTGSNGNSCAAAQSAGTPKQTIAAGLGCVPGGAGGGAGHIVSVANGTYAESFTSFPSGTSGTFFRLISTNSRGATIRPNSTSSPIFYFVGAGNRYLSIEGFVIDGVNVSSNNIWTDPGADFITFDNVELKNTQMGGGQGPNSFQGFFLQGANTIIRNSSIHDIGAGGSGYSHAVYNSAGDNSIIENNDIYNVNGNGMQFYHEGTDQADNGIIRGNKIHNYAIGATTSGIYCCVGTGNNVYNNIIYAPGLSGGRGITVRGSNNNFYNNTIYGNGIGLEIGGGQNVQNNLVYGNTTPISGSAPVMTANQTSNPGYVNAGAGDFHIAGHTATRGVNLSSIFTNDYDGDTRPSSPTAWDVGADEYGTGGPPPDSITVITPNGGGSYTVGQTLTITWTCTGCAGPIDIDLDRGNDGTFEEVIANDTANDGSFDWTVTSSANANCKIRIRDGDASPSDTSDAVFAIAAAAGGSFTKLISDNTVGSAVGDVPGTSDTWMWQLVPTNNYGTDGQIQINKYDAAGHRHQLLKFDGLSQIPSTAAITSVTLGLYLQGGSDATAQTVDVRRLLRNWSESQANWNEYSTANSWNTAGGLGAASDRVSATSAQIASVTTTPGFYTVTVTDASSGTLLDDVKKIVNGTYSNFGWHLERNGTGNDAAIRDYASSEGVDGQRPYLGLIYTTGSATITVTEPSGGTFLNGATSSARWTSQGVSGNVRIDLSRDGGTTWETLVASTPYDFVDTVLTFNAPTSGNCKIRVVSLNDTNIVGTSATFRIGGTRAGFTLN